MNISDEAEKIVIEGIFMGSVCKSSSSYPLRKEFGWMAISPTNDLQPCETRVIAISHLITEKARVWKREYCSHG